MTNVWMTHERYETVEDPKARALNEMAENQARKQYARLHNNSMDGYKPRRQIPCPGTLIFEDKPIADLSPREAVCDHCGFEIGVHRDRVGQRPAPVGIDARMRAAGD